MPSKKVGARGRKKHLYFWPPYIFISLEWHLQNVTDSLQYTPSVIPDGLTYPLKISVQRLERTENKHISAIELSCCIGDSCAQPILASLPYTCITSRKNWGTLTSMMPLKSYSIICSVYMYLSAAQTPFSLCNAII